MADIKKIKQMLIERNEQQIKRENELQYNRMFIRRTKKIRPEVIARIANYYNANYHMKSFIQIEYYSGIKDILKQCNIKPHEFRKYCKQYDIVYNKSTFLYDIPLELAQNIFSECNILEYNNVKKEIKISGREIEILKREMENKANIISNKVKELENSYNELNHKINGYVK
ncbi:hypothetical protein [Clostridium sp. CF012]|uniref:hypothetical protein n=1 Tax=Clostridium sp. CF012 TaxID=2843319 RepID=UPI001C0C3101|nr:hypothetical protein [Clostridium sp. CF012]MBU3145020.1 hypothetical protein [Clostridium sp. CF012]